jgi:hypothetical protein
VEPNLSTDKKDYRLVKTFSLPKTLIGLVQVIYAAVTLYKTRQSEISRFGYAAYGFTVLPYLIMSIVNFIGSILTPEFEKVYLVSSPVLAEAKNRKGHFSGVVGKIVPELQSSNEKVQKFEVVSAEKDLFRVRIISDDTSELNDGENEGMPSPFTEDPPHNEARETELLLTPMQPPTSSFLNKLDAEVAGFNEETPFKISGSASWDIGWSFVWSLCWTTILISFPIAVIGGLTRFHPAESTHAQRVWLMCWLLLGNLGSAIANPFAGLHIYAQLGLLIVFIAPAIGGMVVVAQELMATGSCSRL